MSYASRIRELGCLVKFLHYRICHKECVGPIASDKSVLDCSQTSNVRVGQVDKMVGFRRLCFAEALSQLTG